MEEAKKPFRRRRRHEGSTWTPASQPALPPDGAWCRACKTRHGYMTMGIAYEKRRRRIYHKVTGHQHTYGYEQYWVILWSCRKTGNIIEEMELNRHNGPE